MVIVDWNKTISDISRLLRTLWTYLVFLSLGFLLCFFLNEKRIQSNDVNNTCTIPIVKVTCEPVVRLYQPVTLPKTGVDSACNR